MSRIKPLSAKPGTFVAFCNFFLSWGNETFVSFLWAVYFFLGIYPRMFSFFHVNQLCKLHAKKLLLHIFYEIVKPSLFINLYLKNVLLNKSGCFEISIFFCEWKVKLYVSSIKVIPQFALRIFTTQNFACD